MQGTRRETTKRTEIKQEQQEVEIIKKQKIIEVIKEVPKRVERIVEVEKEVIIDIPIERTI